MLRANLLILNGSQTFLNKILVAKFKHGVKLAVVNNTFFNLNRQLHLILTN